MINILANLLLYVTMFFSFFLPGDPNNVALNVYDAVADDTAIKFSYVNETDKYILNRCHIEKVEKNVAGKWIENSFNQVRLEDAFYQAPGKIESGEFYIEDIEAGEYRMTISYEVVTGLNEYVIGYSTTTFTVTAAE